MIPTYEQAADECRNSQKPSALAWFITEQEPGGIVEEAKFRRELEAVLTETAAEAALRKQSQVEQEFAARMQVAEQSHDASYKHVLWRLDQKDSSQFWMGHAVGICTGGVIAVVTWLLLLFF